MTVDELVAELYEERVEVELSIRKPGQLSGVDDWTIGCWERGLRKPTLDGFVAVADALGLEVVVRKRGRTR